MARACVLLIDGFEETEAITVIDVLRRADAQVSVLGVDARKVTGSHGISVNVDAALDDVVAIGAVFDLVVLPGGMPGAARLRDSDKVRRFVVGQHADGAIAAAICAAPIALAAFGILEGKRATCYPGFEAQLSGAVVGGSDVVVDGRVVTSRGVGTALAFALALVERIAGAPTADTLRVQLLA